MGRLPAAFLLLLALVLVITGAIIGGLWKDVGMGIAGSLIAAVVFALIYQSQLEQFVIGQTKSIIASAVDEGSKTIDATVQRILLAHTTEIGKRLRTYLPLRIWPASDSPHDQFNDIVNTSAAKSTRYRYKGDRALYFVYRMTSLQADHKLPSNCRIDVLICDPREQVCLEGCSRNRFRRSKSKDLAALSKQMKDELYANIYGLWLLRNHGTITIGLTKDIPLFRYELLDSAIFVSVLTSLQDGAFAETVQYEADSDYYQYFGRQFENEMASVAASDTISISSAKSQADILGLLQRLGCTLSADELQVVMDKYKRGLR